MENILSMLIFFPAAAATVGFLIEKNSMRQFGVVVTVVEFILSLLLWYYFDTNATGMQFVQMLPLIDAYGIHYIVGVDGVSLFLIIMITFMTMIALIGLIPTPNLLIKCARPSIDASINLVSTTFHIHTDIA